MDQGHRRPVSADLNLCFRETGFRGPRRRRQVDVCLARPSAPIQSSIALTSIKKSYGGASESGVLTLFLGRAGVWTAGRAAPAI
jgi:hypothetical protein